MTKIEQTYIDKDNWPDGIWKSEPDRVSWTDHFTGYHCLIRRNSKGGGLCGYVSIDKTHPFYGKGFRSEDALDYDYEIIDSLNCHGGITYSAPCDGNTDKGICHLTKDNDDSWWFGFDCAHSCDITPNGEIYDFHARYRNLNYVIFEVELLAKQLKENEKSNKVDLE